jgi:hypothetical protein
MRHMRKTLSHINGVLGTYMLLDGLMGSRGIIALAWCTIGAIVMIASLRGLD